MNCTRCSGTGFLNTHQIDDDSVADDTEAIFEWIKKQDVDDEHDVCVCDCCGNGDEHYGEPGDHTVSDYGPNGPYAYNGGQPECH